MGIEPEEKEAKKEKEADFWICNSVALNDPNPNNRCNYKNLPNHKKCQQCNVHKPILSTIEKYGVIYNNSKYNRKYGSDLLHDDETWMIDLLEPVLNEIYQDDKMLLHFFIMVK